MPISRVNVVTFAWAGRGGPRNEGARPPTGIPLEAF
nr:MAG TPA: hypothetical protein [Caudoviricetes sp.]